MSDESLALARAACAHFTASPTEFHNIANCVALLGPDFVKLDESEVWESKLKVRKDTQREGGVKPPILSRYYVKVSRPT